jgi:hypothetical protein
MEPNRARKAHLGHATGHLLHRAEYRATEDANPRAHHRGVHGRRASVRAPVGRRFQDDGARAKPHPKSGRVKSSKSWIERRREQVRQGPKTSRWLNARIAESRARLRGLIDLARRKLKRPCSLENSRTSGADHAAGTRLGQLASGFESKEKGRDADGRPAMENIRGFASFLASAAVLELPLSWIKRGRPISSMAPAASSSANRCTPI